MTNGKSTGRRPTVQGWLRALRRDGRLGDKSLLLAALTLGELDMREGVVTVNDQVITARMELDPGHVEWTLGRLEEFGYLARVEDDDKGRRRYRLLVPERPLREVRSA